MAADPKEGKYTNDLGFITEPEEKSVDIDAFDENGQTAVHRAAAKGNLDELISLHRKGANLYLEDKSGHTAIQIAKEHKHDELAGKLIRQQKRQIKGAFSALLEERREVKEIDADKFHTDAIDQCIGSLFCFAASFGDYSLVEKLYNEAHQSGIDVVTHKDSASGFTAREIALKKQDKSIAEYIFKKQGGVLPTGERGSLEKLREERERQGGQIYHLDTTIQPARRAATGHAAQRTLATTVNGR